MIEPMHRLSINTIRTLSMDAVEKANSGHPGTPMALAPVVYACGSAFCASTPTIRSGPTVIASCCRSAMRLCCSTACCT